MIRYHPNHTIGAGGGPSHEVIPAKFGWSITHLIGNLCCSPIKLIRFIRQWLIVNFWEEY